MSRLLTGILPASTGVVFPSFEGKKAGFQIAPTLQRALTETQQGVLTWESKHSSNGPDRTDVFTAESGGVQVRLKGTRPDIVAGRRPPTSLKDWEVELTQKGTQFRKVLNGQMCYLPATLSPTSDPAQETIPKLFRAAYEARGAQHETLLPLVNRLTDLLQEGKIGSTSTYLKPNIMYGPPTGVKLLQIGNQSPRLEVSQMGEQVRFTFHEDGKVMKLTEKILENEEIYKALDHLIGEANFQRTGEREGL